MQKSYAQMVKIGDVSLYFSYGTCVAFDIGDGSGLKVTKNYWGPTTGKHLDAIDGGGKEAEKKRMKEDEFNELVEKLKIV